MAILDATEYQLIKAAITQEAYIVQRKLDNYWKNRIENY